MRVAVVGGTGTFGKLAVSELKTRGHEVVSLSRNAPSGAAGGEHRAIDLSTGAGLRDALQGIELVVDASNVPTGGKKARAVLVDGTRRLVEAEAAAGVARHFLISIVGIDRVPMGYYKLKVEQEQVLESAQGVAITILRATQFHQLVDYAFGSASRFGFLPRAGIPVQPVDPREVAAVLADGVGEGLWDGRREFAGPEIRTLTELARAWKRARAKARPQLPVPLVGRLGRALKAGGLTSADAPRAKLTFEQWLAGADSEPVSR
jgi:uncharacterized protein YbjT (DUF2867 family)